jgi:hypothetical protein
VTSGRFVCAGEHALARVLLDMASSVSATVSEAVAAFRVLGAAMTVGEFTASAGPVVALSAQQTAKSALASLLEHNITRCAHSLPRASRRVLEWSSAAPPCITMSSRE